MKQCSHLIAGLTHSYVERGDNRFCLDCVAAIYEKTHEDSLRSIWAQVREADSQQWRASVTASICKAEYCSGDVLAKGYCSLHYHRLYRRGILGNYTPADERKKAQVAP